MEAMPLWICSIASAIIAARHGEGGNRNNYHSAHAMPDIQIDRDPRHRRPLPEAEQKRGEEGREKAEKKKSKREIKAAATDSCEQRVFPCMLLLIFHFFVSYNMDAPNTRWQVKLSHKSTQRMKFSVL